MIFNHLFAQVAISFKIPSSSDAGITLKQVYLNDSFKNRKSASIDFSTGGTPQVTLSNGTADGYFVTPVDFTSSDLGEIGVNYTKYSLPIDVLWQRPSSTKDFFLVWPTPAADLKNIITVVYRLVGSSTDQTATMSLPEGTSWVAGNKYQYTITYTSGVLKIVENVLPWDYEKTTIPAAEAPAVTVMASWVGWDENTCSVAGNDVSFIEDSGGNLLPIHGTFKIHSPEACTFALSMTQNTGNYTISPASGTIGSGSGEIQPGTAIDFYITANNRSASSDITSGMTFSVNAGGRVYSLDSELQRDGAFNIIIPKE